MSIQFNVVRISCHRFFSLSRSFSLLLFVFRVRSENDFYVSMSIIITYEIKIRSEVTQCILRAYLWRNASRFMCVVSIVVVVAIPALNFIFQLWFMWSKSVWLNIMWLYRNSNKNAHIKWLLFFYDFVQFLFRSLACVCDVRWWEYDERNAHSNRSKNSNSLESVVFSSVRCLCISF